MKIRIINKLRHKLPEYTTERAAGMDVGANIDEDIVLAPMKKALVRTGLYLGIPAGYEAQIRPRSGLAISMDITVLNSPDTLDADYRGEVCVILINPSDEKFVIRDGREFAR